jgi:glycolate oxidase FAD binding subunit
VQPASGGVDGRGSDGPRSGEGPPARANVVVLHCPRAVGELVDLFGPVPSLTLMRAVKNQFDPTATMAPGRFAGGI